MRASRGHRSAYDEGVRGGLEAAIPVPFVVASWAHGDAAVLNPTTALGFACLASLLVGAAAFTSSAGRWSRVAPWLAAGSLVGLAAPRILDGPMTAFLTLLLVAGGGGLLRRVHRRPGPLREGDAREPGGSRLLGAAACAVAVWLVCAGAGLVDDAHVVAAVGLLASFLIVMGRGASALARNEGTQAPGGRGIRAAALAGTCVLMVVAWKLRGLFPDVLGAAAVHPVLVLATEWRRHGERRPPEPSGSIADHPELYLLATFLGLILVGTALLVQPACTATGHEVRLVDAAFTAVSAVCVTGLVVLDTPTDFSRFGQLAILVLIQLGGIGMMAFSATAFRMLGRRMSLRHEAAASKLLAGGRRSRLFETARTVLVFTVVVEASGAAVLALCFRSCGDTVPGALWRALFTAVSAFCNAGFALQSDSLIPYQGQPVILHAVGSLIVLGGLSPLLAVSLPRLLRPGGRPVPLQARIALGMTALLLVTGFVLVAAIEWNRTLGPLGLADRLHNAWFQSVTLRTAGFNSLDVSALHPALLTLMMVWMFVGGCPGGTAGGIKVTTAAVVGMAVVAAVRGERSATAFGRRVAAETVHKALAIAAVGASVAMAAFLALQLTQNLPDRMALFEVVSALGTVGLSTGGTGRLDLVGKLVVMACMFVGRVGPLSLFMVLRERQVGSATTVPEEGVEVG